MRFMDGNKTNEIKVRYKQEDYKRLKKKAKKLNLSVNEYQKTISKKAKVKVE